MSHEIDHLDVWLTGSIQAYLFEIHGNIKISKLFSLHKCTVIRFITTKDKDKMIVLIFVLNENIEWMESGILYGVDTC